MRIIDADDLRRLLAERRLVLRKANECGGCEAELFEKVMNMVDEQPTVDAELVVRCHECKYAGAFDRHGFSLCSNTGCEVQLMEYCSDGERKQAEETDITVNVIAAPVETKVRSE